MEEVKESNYWYELKEAGFPDKYQYPLYVNGTTVFLVAPVGHQAWYHENGLLIDNWTDKPSKYDMIDKYELHEGQINSEPIDSRQGWAYNLGIWNDDDENYPQYDMFATKEEAKAEIVRRLGKGLSMYQKSIEYITQL
jgi:hypothetical protein